MTSPQRAGRHVARHAAFGVLMFAAPASHDAPSGAAGGGGGVGLFGFRRAVFALLAERFVDDSTPAFLRLAARAARRVGLVRVEPAVVALLAFDRVDHAVATSLVRPAVARAA